MRTLTCTSPFHFAYTETEQPLPAPGTALIAIKRIGICGTDLHAFEGTQPFFSYPRILGHELAGELIACDDAPGFSVGEKVTFIPYFNCGHCIACRSGLPNCCTTLQVCGVHADGGMREYLRVPSASLLHGDGLSYDELALAEPLAIGAHGVRRADIKAGEYVLVNGAGPIGLAVMEFARIAGAYVIALDVNTQRLDFCTQKLGVKTALNARDADIFEQVSAVTGGYMPTVVIDATGNLGAITNAFRYLAHGGRYVLVGLQKGEISFSHPEFHKREAALMSSRNATRADFEQVLSALKNKDIDPTTYITHRFAFHDLAANFADLIKPETGVIKAMVDLNS